VIECGSLEYAHGRLQARHGQRAGEPVWRRIEVTRDFAPLLELARATALRPWLDGITADSTDAQIESTLRGHWRTRIAELVGWMPEAWQSPVAWCAVLPDLGPLQHLARGGEPAPWMEDDTTWRALCAAQPSERAALLAAGPLCALAAAWALPQTIGDAWLAEWKRRLPHAIGDAGDALPQVVRALVDHRTAFAGAAQGQGWLLRAALSARLSLLLRRAGAEPAAVFIHLALCALDLERLRAELLRRVLFPHWTVT
jgi:hypothetical protein